MSDSPMPNLKKLKVIELRKELKNRGLPSTGTRDELLVRLQGAIDRETEEQESQDDTGEADINLDSDEIDSDVVLDDDEKSNNDLLEESTVDDLVLEEPAPVPKPEPEVTANKPQKSLKRKITMSDTTEQKTEPESDKKDEKETGGKKIVLHRKITFTSNSTNTKPVTESKSSTDASNTTVSTDLNKAKIAALDAKARLELRAKRFGLPVKVSDVDLKEARKNRFGMNTGSITKSDLPSDMLKLKQRAERFGQSVSKLMADVENKERLEKRKAKFGTAK